MPRERVGRRRQWRATAGRDYSDPHLQGHLQTRTRARDPPRVRNRARARDPRVTGTRGLARMPAKELDLEAQRWRAMGRRRRRALQPPGCERRVGDCSRRGVRADSRREAMGLRPHRGSTERRCMLLSDGQAAASRGAGASSKPRAASVSAQHVCYSSFSSGGLEEQAGLHGGEEKISGGRGRRVNAAYDVAFCPPTERESTVSE